MMVVLKYILLFIASFWMVACNSESTKQNGSLNKTNDSLVNIGLKQNILIEIYLKSLSRKFEVYKVSNLINGELWMLVFYDRIVNHPLGFSAIFNTETNKYVLINNYFPYYDLENKVISVEYIAQLTTLPLLRLNDLLYSDWQFGRIYSLNEVRSIAIKFIRIYGSYSYRFAGFDKLLLIENLRDVDQALISIERNRKELWSIKSLFDSNSDYESFREFLISNLNEDVIMFYDGIFIHRAEILLGGLNRHVIKSSPFYVIKYYIY